MKANDEGIVKMLVLLQKRPCSTRTITTFCGLYREKAKRLLDLMYEAKLIYIEGWYPIGRSKARWPHYMWKEDGDRDAPRPAKKTPEEKLARMRELYWERKANIGMETV